MNFQKIESSINGYDNKINFEKQPKLYDSSGSQVFYKNSVKKGKTYRLEFLDGTFDIKI